MNLRFLYKIRPAATVSVSILLLFLLLWAMPLRVSANVSNVLSPGVMPDENMRIAVAVQFGINADDVLTPEAAALRTALDLSNADIENLAGIEHFWGLKELNISGNYIENFTLPAQLSPLEQLNISNNPNLETLTINNAVHLYAIVLGYLPDLETLQITNTAVTQINLANLGGGADAALERLIVTDNRLLEQISAYGLPLLENVNASANPLLAELRVHDTALTSLNIATTPLLARLNISNTLLTTLNLDTRPALTNLYAANTRLTSLNVSSAVNIVSVDISRNDYLTSFIADAAELTSLATLDMRNNPVLTTVRIPRNALTTLASDFLYGTDALQTLDMAGSSELTQLDIVGHPALVTLNVSGSPNLHMLDIRGNPRLQTLNTANLPVLTHLRAPSNAVTALNLTASTQLQTLYAPGNRLSALDLRPHRYLQELDVSANVLTSLQLPTATAGATNNYLERINVSGNRLTTVNVLYQRGLRRLDVSGNRLTSLNIRNGLWYLHDINASGNLITAFNWVNMYEVIDQTNPRHVNLQFNAIDANEAFNTFVTAAVQHNTTILYTPQLQAGINPVIAEPSPSPQIAEIGVFFELPLHTAPVWGWPLTWRVASGTLPPGLSLNAHEAVISGTPTAMGTFTFTIGAGTSARGINADTTRQITITVAPPHSLVINPSSVILNEDNLTSYVTVAGGGNMPITIYDRGGLPAGVTLSVSSNRINITAVRPAAGQPAIEGSFTVSIRRAGTPAAFVINADIPPLPLVNEVRLDPREVLRIERGHTAVPQLFTAEVYVNGEHMPNEDVTWTISGQTSAQTRIERTGYGTATLFIAPNETASVITVRAAAELDSAIAGIASVRVYIPATGITMTANAGQVGVPFNLAANARFVPAQAIPDTTQIQWTRVGGTSPDAFINEAGHIITSAEGTVIVRGYVPGGINRGNVITSPNFTITFSAGTIEASLHGLDILYEGIAVQGETRFELHDADFAAVITAADFRVMGLPPGLTAGAPVRRSDNVVVVPITGTPLRANPNAATVSIGTTLHQRNILRGTQPVPISPPNFVVPHVYPSASVRVPQVATFDLNPLGAMHRDVQVTLAAGDWELRGIMYRNYRLIPYVDFTTVTGGQFRLFTAFLRQLAIGEWSLVFDMYRGANPHVTLNIIDTRIQPRDEGVPADEPDRSLLDQLVDDDLLIFVSGALPVRVATLGLESGLGAVRPVMQGGQASLWIRADVLEYLAWRHPNAILEARTRLGNFRFPTYMLDKLRGARAAISLEGLPHDMVYVRITFTDVSGNAEIAARVQQAFPGGQVLAPPTDLQIELVRRSDQHVFFTVRELLRPFEWLQTLMPQSGVVRYGAFWFNNSPSRLEYAPHRSRGANEIVIRSIFTGTHAIINNGAFVNDISFHHWAFERAYTATRTGLVQLQGGNIVGSTPMTRAEFAQLISFGLQLKSPGFVPAFADVPSNHWAHDAIMRVRYAGLLDNEASFRPDAHITRGEVMTIITAAITRGTPERVRQSRPLANYFTDHWEVLAHQRISLQLASDYGIFFGFPDASLRPNDVATRMESISMVVELMRVMGGIDE